jgi:hypothetical protein
MITVTGKGNIKATVVADSISESGQRITTFELEYPRFIHSEFMTHRQFSRNAASSRAIPVSKVIEQVETNPAMPIHWGKNQSGMQANEEVDEPEKAEFQWRWIAKEVTKFAGLLAAFPLHKQIVNRILEPFQMIKVVCTATEYDNFFYLRMHKDAQPEIRELSRLMHKARRNSVPNELKYGEWHLPYVGASRDELSGELEYCTADYREGDCEDNRLLIYDAIKLSASLCAQVSYRLSDQSLEKALKIYDQLVTMKPVHASPFEHQATPMALECELNTIEPETWEAGVTHMGINGLLWSGNFKGWVQNRQLIKDHVYNGKGV